MEIFVYLDILLIENIVINYFILLVTSKFSKNRSSNLRLFLGALTGAAYVAMMVCFPVIASNYNMWSKILLSALIVAISFSHESISGFFKTLAIFYVSTFIFAGSAYAFMTFNQSGGFIKNGIYYNLSQSKWSSLVLSIILAGIIIRIFMEIIQFRFAKDKLLVKLKISFENQSIDLSALIDTGNSLYDPLTNMPVVVVEYGAIKDILPQEIREIFEKYKDSDLACVTAMIANSKWLSRFRLIPFSSLGKDNGMLIGFKPDYIKIGEDKEKKGINNVIVGIYNNILSKNSRYRALLSPELI
ncbi:MAG TPA: sigma-E processing peptidase SpoIIGA [Clostridiaceae bacterium]|nr:sigma-E processing peptidase SpoIIGA [Clostridiaceae bacterium]